MVRPTLEQFFCHPDYLLAEYEALGVANARQRVTAMCKELFHYFGHIETLHRQEKLSNRLHVARAKQQVHFENMFAKKPKRLSYIRNTKDIGMNNRYNNLMRSVIQAMKLKLSRKLLKFPELADALPEVDTKLVFATHKTMSRVFNYRKRQARKSG